MGRFIICLVVCLAVLMSNVSVQAGVDEQVKFKMVCSDTDLIVGETTTVYVQAWVDSVFGIAGNGLDTWQMDLSVDISGVIGIDDESNISLIAPNPDPAWSGWTSVNTPATGAITEIAVTQLDLGASSEIGVGGYSDIFSFQIEALAEGTATYSLASNGVFAFLADSEWFENTGGADGGIFFDAAGSDNVFTVIPEPCTMLLLGIGCMALRQRS